MNPDDGNPAKSVGPAIQKLKQLKLRWGVVGEVDSWKQAPQLIQVRAMDNVETWRLRAAHPNDPPKTVDLNDYELVESKKA